MSGITIECPVHFRKARAGQKKLKAGESPQKETFRAYPD